jgi:hypothetical protein
LNQRREGRVLVQLWNLPAILEEMIAYHHIPGDARQYPFEAYIIHMADCVAHEMELGESREQYILPLDKKAWKLVGIPESALSFISDPYCFFTNQV